MSLRFIVGTSRTDLRIRRPLLSSATQLFLPVGVLDLTPNSESFEGSYTKKLFTEGGIGFI